MNKGLIAYCVVATLVAGAAGATCFRATNIALDQQQQIEDLNTIIDIKQSRLDDYASRKITIDILDKQINDAQKQLETLQNETDSSN